MSSDTIYVIEFKSERKDGKPVPWRTSITGEFMFETESMALMELRNRHQPPTQYRVAEYKRRRVVRQP